jgi:hypothetical protein
MMNARWLRAPAILIALTLSPLGCGSDDEDGPPASATQTPAVIPTPTAGLALDVSICAPDAGPFSATIDNPFFPLPVGAEWVLVGESEGSVVRVVVTSLAATETVAGVTTRVVEEREWEDDALVEVSRNFFAQNADGTVCYYGEDVDIYEDGEIVSHDGAWRAGPSAQPGIFMPGDPRVGQTFKQEIAPGIAEDEAELVAAGETVEVDFGTFTDTIRFSEFNPLDGGTSEKIYARGVGLIVDVPVERIAESTAGARP